MKGGNGRGETYNDDGVHGHAHVDADRVAGLEVLSGLPGGRLDAFEVAGVPFGKLCEVEELDCLLSAGGFFGGKGGMQDVPLLERALAARRSQWAQLRLCIRPF